MNDVKVFELPINLVRLTEFHGSISRAQSILIFLDCQMKEFNSNKVQENKKQLSKVFFIKIKR